MKKIAVPLVIILFLLIGSVNAQKPAFFVTCSHAEGDSVAKYAKNFERWVATQLSDAFHCARVNTQSNLIAAVKAEKEDQLTGASSGMDGKFCDKLACDYLVILSLTEVNNSLLMAEIDCMDRKKAKAFVDAAGSYTTRMDYAGIAESCKMITGKFLKELSTHEICPFRGPVSVNITSTFDTTTVEEYGIYCNGMDQRYKKETETHNSTISDWQLKKNGLSWTDGTMTFHSSEISTTVEADGCHTCKTGGRQGGRTSTEHKSFIIDGSGISHESSRNGKPQDDTRIELKFFENGTYVIILKGTSETAKGDEKVKEQAEGTCDNITPQNMIVPREMKVPLNTVFGPYPGKASDKLLSKQDSKETRDPVTKEKHKITIDFELKPDN
jgi:hypothetical protein